MTWQAATNKSCHLYPINSIPGRPDLQPPPLAHSPSHLPVNPNPRVPRRYTLKEGGGVVDGLRDGELRELLNREPHRHSVRVRVQPEHPKIMGPSGGKTFKPHYFLVIVTSK